MFQLYSVNFLNNEMPGNTVLHRRGNPFDVAQRPCVPTKANNQRCYGFIKKGMFRNISVVLLVLVSSLALAHKGFNTVLENTSVNAYTVTMLEDTHLANEHLQTSLMIQVANGREAAPADTTVKLRLEQDSKIVYEDHVKYVGSSSSDGRTFYAYYLVTIPLSDLNSYNMRLELKGLLGNAETTLDFQPKLAPEFRATELIPSLLILSICLAGAAMFIVSSRQPSHQDQSQKGFHHA